MSSRKSAVLAGLVIAAAISTVAAADPSPAPAYAIVLRSRRAEAIPNRSKDAQTGGGSIVVEQPEAHTVVVTMGGAAVAGSDCHGSSAAIDFQLEQDLEIVATRTGLRPPRIGLVGRVVGTLQVTDPGKCGALFGGGKCGKSCGSAEQGPATACLAMGDANLLSINVQSSSACCGQESAINFRDGPNESTAAVGCYRLCGAFRIGASQGKGIWRRQFAVADFDTAPQLDAFWADALRPFRAVPRRDFGFKIALRVIEDPAPQQ
jgi:hypothetical protein